MVDHGANAQIDVGSGMCWAEEVDSFLLFLPPPLPACLLSGFFTVADMLLNHYPARVCRDWTGIGRGECRYTLQLRNVPKVRPGAHSKDRSRIWRKAGVKKVYKSRCAEV